MNSLKNISITYTSILQASLLDFQPTRGHDGWITRKFDGELLSYLYVTELASMFICRVFRNFGLGKHLTSHNGLKWTSRTESMF